MSALSAPAVVPGLLSTATPALPGPNSSAAKVRKTAEDFESSFISAMLQPIFDKLSTDGPFGGGQGEAAFKSFMVDAMSKQMTKAGGIGLADSVQREIIRMQGGA